MEEVAAKRPEEVRALQVNEKPPLAHLQGRRASPPLSALRADSSSIEEERGLISVLREEVLIQFLNRKCLLGPSWSRAQFVTSCAAETS
jgi:hypothetical protein